MTTSNLFFDSENEQKAEPECLEQGDPNELLEKNGNPSISFYFLVFASICQN